MSTVPTIHADFGKGGAGIATKDKTGVSLRMILAAIVVDILALEALFVPSAQVTRYVRGVVTANVANLAAFTVASNDGLTYAEGEKVLLAKQTTAAQCGVYVVGAVAGGTAPLTRVADLAAGMTYINGSVVEVSEGTLWAGSSWKAMCTGTKIVGTDDPLFYPKTVHRTVTLVAGTVTINSDMWLFSTTKSTVTVTRNTANTSTLTTGGYSAAVAGRTAGKGGTGAVTVQAEVAAGTINVADISTLDVLVTNAG